MSRQSLKVFAACAAALVAFGARASVCDLNGTDLEVTSLADYPDGFTNSSETLATLTVTVSSDVTYAGPISGNLKLVKRGQRDLSINVANSFTGGTEIYLGRIVVGNSSALGTGEIYVESDCSQQMDSTDSSRLSALTLKNSITNDLRFSSWSAELPYVKDCCANYNLQTDGSNASWLNIYGKVTGGSISLDTSKDRVRSNSTFNAGATFSVFMSTVDCSAGTVYLMSRNVIQFREQTKIRLLTGFAHKDYGRYVGFWPKSNAIAEFRISGDNPIGYNGNCWPGTVFVTTNYLAGSNGKYGSICMSGKNKTIDRFVRGVEQGTYNAWYPRRVYSDDGTPEPTTALTFTMAGTGDSTCDFAFDNNISLVWAPTGAYTMSCVGDRQNRTTGALTVSGGAFEVTGTTTFSNLTAITVASGATFRNDGTAPGAFRSVKALSAASGATLELGGVASWTAQQVAMTAAGDAQIALPTDGQLELLSLSVGGNAVLPGTYGASELSCFTGAGTVKVTTSLATWTAGATPDDGIETVANWDKADVAGQLRNGSLNATFGDAGSRAVVSEKELFRSIAVNRTFTFEKGADGAEVGSLGDMTLSGSAQTTFETPFNVAATQTWTIAAGHTLVVTGGLVQTEARADKLTVSATGTGNAQFFGTGDASSFAGPVDIRGKVYAEGDDPFGRAADGVDGTVTLYSGIGSSPALEVGTCRITKPFKTSGTWSDGDYFRTKSALSNKPRGYYTLTFAGPVDIGSGTNFRLGGWRSEVVFEGGGSFLATLRSYAGDFTVTNKPLAFTLKDSPQTTVNFHLLVASNRVDAITPTSYFFNLDCGADWALYEGNTTVKMMYHDNNGSIGGSTFDLAGHPQRIGSLYSRFGTVTHTDSKTQVQTVLDPFAVTPPGRCQITSASPATLYVNQTEDGMTLSPFTGKASLCKEGSAALVLTNCANTAEGALTVAGGTLELADAPWQNATNVTVSAATGDATLKLSTKLSAEDVPANKFFGKGTFDLRMSDGEGTAKLELAEGVCELANTFELNGTLRPGSTYGSSESSASTKDDVHFAGKGILVVAHPRGMIMIFR